MNHCFLLPLLDVQGLEGMIRHQGRQDFTLVTFFRLPIHAPKIGTISKVFKVSWVHSISVTPNL